MENKMRAIGTLDNVDEQLNLVLGLLSEVSDEESMQTAAQAKYYLAELKDKLIGQVRREGGY